MKRKAKSVWRKKPGKKSGWYWMNVSDWDEPELVWWDDYRPEEIIILNCHRDISRYNAPVFSGPLIPPKAEAK